MSSKKFKDKAALCEAAYSKLSLVDKTILHTIVCIFVPSTDLFIEKCLPFYEDNLNRRLASLEKKGLIVGLYSSYNVRRQFQADPVVSALLLPKLSKTFDYEKIAHLIISVSPNNHCLLIGGEILDYLKSGIKPDLDCLNENQSTSEFLNLYIDEWTYVPGLCDVIDFLPQNIIADWLDFRFTNIYSQIGSFESSEYSSRLKSLTFESAPQVYAMYYLLKGLASGDFSEVPPVTKDSVSYIYLLNALKLQFEKGDSLKIFELYRKGFASSEEGVIMSIYIFAFFALVKNNPELNPKFKIVRQKKVRDRVLMDGYILSMLSALTDSPVVDKNLKSTYSEPVFIPSNFDTVMVEKILTDYEIRNNLEGARRAEIVNLMKDKRFDYLRLELGLTELPLPSDSGFCINGYTSLFGSCKKTEVWETALDLIIGGKTSVSNKQKAQSLSRIVYLVDEDASIRPKLQKSKDGINWTAGRNIAMSTFKQGIDEMQELDRRIASHVRMYSPYYYGDGVCYDLSGIKPLQLLVGYPYVYMESNPSVAMEVVEEPAYLSINRTNKGFEIQTNFFNPDLNDSYYEFESNTRIKIMTITAKQKKILTLLTTVGSFPFSAEDKLKELIKVVGQDITIYSDLIKDIQQFETVQSDSRIIIQLLPLGDSFKADFFVKPLGVSAPYCQIATGPETVIGTVDGKKYQTTRNFAKEKSNYKLVCSALSSFESEKPFQIMLDTPKECLELLNTVHSMDDSVVGVEWPEGVKLKLVGKASLSDFSLSLKGKNSWFEMQGSLKYGDENMLALSQILNEINQTSEAMFVSVGENEYLAISDDLKRILKSIDSMSVQSKKGMQISQFAAPMLGTLEKEGVEISSDVSYKKLLKKINDTRDTDYLVPKQLQASLRDYQEEGFRWMARLSDWGSGACLADDMGLGKTIQTICMLLYKAKDGASLVVAPASVMPNWQNEIFKFAPALNVKVLNSDSDRALLVANAADFDVVLTTYGILSTELDALSQKKWSVVALDEAHTIKNKETKMSKAAMQLQADFRLLLTGTPIQNHLSEIWNLFQFMNPGLLGSFDHFSQKYIIPIEVNNDKEVQKDLKRLVSPFLLRRTKNEVLDELPGKTEIVLPVELNREEELFYEGIRRQAEYSLENNELNAVQTLAEITRLRQAASNVGLVNKNYKGQSSKIETFLSLLQEIKENNHRALVFSQFTSHLDIVRKTLDKQGVDYLYLDGAVSIKQREKLVKSFQTGSQVLFLISLKAGGLGLNLTAADFIVHLDPWWNPAIEDQASDRAYRIGQTRPVTVYRLIASNTIEEKIIELHKTKKDLADSLLEGTNMSHKLSREDLLDLLKK